MKMDITQRCHLLIEDLSVARGERVVFGQVSLRVGSGEIAEVTGPNPKSRIRRSWQSASTTWAISTG